VATVRKFHLEHHLKLRQLRVIVSVAQHESISKAARALGITQPALTKSVKEVEEALGVRIFDRTTRGVRSNVFGVAVVDRARLILAELERLKDDVVRLDTGESGVIAIGALPVAAAGLLPRAIAKLRERYPALGVRISQGLTDELLASVAAGELDMMVGRLYETITRNEFQRQILYREPLSIVVRDGHPLLDRQPIEGADLAQFELILPSSRQKVYGEVLQLLTNIGIHPGPNALQTNDFGFIKETLLTSDLVGILPRVVFAGDISRGLIKTVVTQFPAQMRLVGIMFPRGRLRPAGIVALAEILREQVGEMRKEGLIDDDHVKSSTAQRPSRRST